MRFNVKSLPRLAPAWIAISVALLIAVGASAQSPGRSTEPGWIADPNTGCKVWNPAPEPEERVTWSGSCVDGFADGPGVEQWYRGDQKGNRLEGQFYRGRPTGTLTVTYPNGVQYIGKISASGGPSGVGTIIWTNGDRFEGKVLDGFSLPEGDGVWTFKNDPLDLNDNHELRAWGITLYARANHLHELGRYTEAEALQKRALAISEKALGRDHQNVAASLLSLVEIYVDQGRYTEAEALQKRALAIREKALGPDHPDIARSLASLAGAYSRQRRYTEAEALLKRALAISEKALGPDHPNVAVYLNNLAVIYADQGDYAEAEALLKRALAIKENALGPDHPGVASSLDNLAGVYSRQGRYTAAEALLKRAVGIAEKALDPDHPDIARSLASLAGAYSRQRRYTEAEALLKRALAIREKTLDPDHPDVARSLESLAVVYARQGRYTAAEALLKRALAIRETTLAPDHSDVAQSLGYLAALYYKKALHNNAEALEKRALAIREKELGSDHLYVSWSLNSLAVIYADQGDYAEAEALLKRALAIKENALGPDHPGVASSLDNLAGVYSRQGRYTAAEALLKRAIAISEKALGRDHQNVAFYLNSLAVTYADQGEYTEAEALQKRVLDIMKNSLGSDHPDAVTSLVNIAGIYALQHRYTEAAIALRPMIERGQALSTSHPILYDFWSAKLISQDEALSMSLSIAQTSRVSGARDAISKLAQRFSTGRGEQAEIIRRDQDLGNQLAAMDEFLTAQFSKVPERRNKDAEANIRQRIAEIEAERTGIAATLAARFPDYVALTKPPVLSVADIQALLADDEALIAFDVAEKGYTWVITRETADWTEVATTAATLTSEVQALRSTLAFEEGKPAQPFDAALAYKIYQQTLGPLADKFAGKKRLSVYVNGALSGIPLQLLVTEDPTGKAAKDIDWLVKSAAITNLPSIYSLKASRRQLPPSAAKKPMVAFADPVFSREARAQAVSQQIALRGVARQSGWEQRGNQDESPASQRRDDCRGATSWQVIS